MDLLEGNVVGKMLLIIGERARLLAFFCPPINVFATNERSEKTGGNDILRS